jgi:hypothetical protein
MTIERSSQVFLTSEHRLVGSIEKLMVNPLNLVPYDRDLENGIITVTIIQMVKEKGIRTTARID